VVRSRSCNLARCWSQLCEAQSNFLDINAGLCIDANVATQSNDIVTMVNVLPLAILGLCLAAGAYMLGLCGGGGARKQQPAAAAAAAPPARAAPRPAAPAPAPAPEAPAVEGGFDPNRSRVDPSVREFFIQSENSSDDVEVVPGVGEVTAKLLKRKSSNPPTGIHTVANLLGKFLVLREQGMTPQEHCDAFALWLGDIGVNTRSIHNIVLVISDKAGSLMPRLRYTGIVPRNDAQ